MTDPQTRTLQIDPIEELLLAGMIVHGAPRRVRTMEQARDRAHVQAQMIRAALAAPPPPQEGTDGR